jgi:hypothetical protein
MTKVEKKGWALRGCARGVALLALVAVGSVSASTNFSELYGYEPRYFPPLGSVHIKNIKTDFGAKGDGVTDDTEAFRQAILFGQPRTIYIPKGIYLISDSLRYGEGSTKDKKRTLLIGECRTETIIRLKDGAKGFDDPAKPKVFIHTRRKALQGENNMFMYLYHLTIEIDTNNPGAIALNFHTNNSGAIYDVAVRAADAVNHRPLRGIAFDDYWFGPGGARFVEVSGFRTGLHVGSATNHTTLEHINVSDCDTAFVNRGDAVSGRQWNARRCKVGVFNQGTMTVVQSSFTGGQGGSAIIDDDRLMARDITTQGYTKAISSSTSSAAGPAVTHFLSQAASWTFQPASDAQQGLGLPVEQSPDFQYPSSSAGWTLIPASKDLSPALQKAIDEGKEFIALDGDSMKSTVVLRNKVKKIMAAGVRSINMATGKEPAFVLAAGEPGAVVLELVYETYGSINGNVFEHAAPRTLVVRHGSGSYHNTTAAAGAKVFMESVIGYPFVFTGVNGWLRDINTEQGGQNKPNIVNDGGVVWILGQKTEDWATKLKTVNGGWTELLGGTFRQNWDNEDLSNGQMTVETAPPLFEITDAHASLSFVTMTAGLSYRVLVREKRDGQTKELIHKNYEGGTVNGGHALYLGYKNPPPTAAAHPGRSFAAGVGGPRMWVERGAVQLAFFTPLREAAQCALFTLGGRQVASQQLAPGQSHQQIALGALPSGVYLLQVRHANTIYAHQCVYSK